MSPLDPISQQQDFSLGMFRSGALEREPDGAAETIVGLLGDDGLPYKRGGSVYKNGFALGTTGLLWMIDTYLAGGRRTVYGHGTSTRVLDVDDVTPVNPASTAPTAITRPFRPVVVQGGMLMIPNADVVTEWNIYAGSRKTAAYSTGTVTVTQGSMDVVGVGTSWNANVDAGMVLEPGFVPVRHVNSNTTLTLAQPYPFSTLAGIGYALRPMSSLGGTAYAAVPRSLPIAASIGGRFVIVDADNPTQFWFTEADQVVGVQDQNYHRFTGEIRGFGVLRDALLVFTTGGVFAVSGMAYPLVDPGSGDPLQREELVNADLVAWGHEGIASWEGALVVPALDNVYLMDSLGAPTPIGGRILDLYLSYVQAGYMPGVAEVYNGHYFLPVLNGTTWVDMLVCRLQPSHSGNNFAWTQLSGHGVQVAALSERQTVPPLLLGANLRDPSIPLEMSTVFRPSAAVKNDPDGTAPSFQLTTIDYPTGNSVSNFVHHVRLMYELTDAAADDPTMAAEVSVDGAAFTALTGVAGEGSGEKKWRVNRHAKNVRFRFTVNPASASCKVKSVEVFVRHSGKQ